MPGSPRHLRQLQEVGLNPRWVALDTETSGLFADDGARVSTVSVAWVDYDGEWGPDRFDGLTYRVEEIAPGYSVPIVSVAWPFDQGVAGKPEERGAEMLWPDAENLDLEEWLQLGTWLLEIGSITMHNSPFDNEKMEVGVARFNGEGWGGPDLTDIVDYDTQNINDMLWGWEKTSLKPTCARLFGKEMEDEATKVKEYLRKNKLPAGRWDLMPWDIVGPYADLDARLTVMLRLRQEWEISEGAGGWLPDPHAAGRRRLAVSGTLRRMTRRGVPYHAERSREAAREARARMAPLAQALPFEPGSDKQAKRYFFDELGVEPYAVSEKTGEPSLTAEILQRMVLDNVPHAADLAAWRRADTAVSMWYEGYPKKIGEDDRLRTYFRQNGTRSHRFSVERVQLQAIPADYRFSGVEILAGIPTPKQLIGQAVAEFWPGWKLWVLDLAQAELRIASMYAGESKMLQMIADGTDLHGFTATQLFGVRPGDGQWDLYRQVGKRGNFSLGFGSGGATFQWMLAEQAGIRWDIDRCDEVVRGWRRLYPAFVGSTGRGGAVASHQSRVEARMRADLKAGGPGRGYLQFKNGERRWFQPYEEAHKAFNQRVQGNQAQYSLDWLLASERYLRGLGLDHPGANWGWAGTRGGQAGLLLPVHDSQVLLLPAGDEGEEMANMCAEMGRALWKQWFPGVPGDIDVKEW